MKSLSIEEMEDFCRSIHKDVTVPVYDIDVQLYIVRVFTGMTFY